MPKTSLARLSALRALTHARDYLLACDQAVAASASADELIERMTSLYPKLEHRAAVRLSAFIDHQETHPLLGNPPLDTGASYLPSGFVAGIDAWLPDRRRRAANLE